MTSPTASFEIMKQYCVIVCLSLFVYLNAADDISIDYYFGRSVLRSDDSAITCEKADFYRCLASCPHDHVCFMKKCMCIHIGVDDQVSRMPLLKERSYYVNDKEEEVMEPSDFIDLTKITGRSYSNYDHPKPSRPNEDLPISSLRQQGPQESLPKPALRHHIAHFCPNLDIARECIRKCIPLGKPAFCGKDHVCYCGHNYNKMPRNDKQEKDGKEVYSEFKDLYQKYFGNNYGMNHFESTTEHIASTSEEE